MKQLSEMGPIQILAVEFEGTKFEGKIWDEIRKLKDQGMIRLVDALVVTKGEDGTLAAAETSDLTKEEATEYGAVIGALLGLGSGDEQTAEATSAVFAERFNERYEFGLDREDLEDLAEGLPEGSSLLTLLIEHKWAIPLRNAMRQAGGVLMAQDFLSPELLMSVGNRMFAEQ